MKHEICIMIIKSLPKISGLSAEEFKKFYLEKNIPVIFKDLTANWKATKEWNFQFFSDRYGHLTVPVYDPSFSLGGKTYMKPTGFMSLAEYLDIIQSGPSNLRIFLWNIFKHAPELANYIEIPTIMNGFYKEYPFMFFGGQGSYTKIHYDVDCSHVFLTQFQTQKKVILFSQNQSKNLGRIPFTVGCLVDMINPDEKKYPSLKHVEGWEAKLEHGETLFIPSMYWHHIEYIDPGFSISLRASHDISQKIKGFTLLIRHLAVDRGMNLVMGHQWEKIKHELALKKMQKV